MFQHSYFFCLFSLQFHCQQKLINYLQSLNFHTNKMKYTILLLLTSSLFLGSTAFSQEDDIKMIIAEGVEIDSSLISPEAEMAYNSGVDAFKKDQYGDAIQLFSQAIELYPDFEKAYSNRAYCYLSLNNVDKARADFLKLTEIAERPDNAFYELGAIHSEAGDSEKAIEFYSKAIESNAIVAKYHYQKGLENFKLEKYEAAKDDFTGAIVLDKKYAHAYNDRGSANRMLEKMNDAILDYKAATMHDNTLLVAFNNLGSAYREKGEFDNAIKSYTDAINKNKNAYLSLNNRGYAKFEKGDYKGAIEDFKLALSVNKDYAFAYNNMAGAYIKLEQFKEAVDAATKAIQLDKEFGYAFYNRGVAQEMLRNEIQACEDWLTASSLGVNLAESYYQNNGCSSLISE